MAAARKFEPPYPLPPTPTPPPPPWLDRWTFRNRRRRTAAPRPSEKSAESAAAGRPCTNESAAAPAVREEEPEFAQHCAKVSHRSSANYPVPGPSNGIFYLLLCSDRCPAVPIAHFFFLSPHLNFGVGFAGPCFFSFLPPPFFRFFFSFIFSRGAGKNKTNSIRSLWSRTKTTRGGGGGSVSRDFTGLGSGGYFIIPMSSDGIFNFERRSVFAPPPWTTG